MNKLVVSMCLVLLSFANAAAQDRSYAVSGLEKEAEIIVDEWGVPHMYANTHYDAFFVQGFNAARDRLWQIDVWRRRGLGKLSEVFGADYVEQDRATRLFLYRGDMYREWLAYGSDAKRIAEAFTSGINAYIELTDEYPELLPPEFELLDYRPARWSPEDVVRIRSHGLLYNVNREIRRARIACHAGLEIAAVRKQLEPEWTTKIPEGLDPCVIPADVLKTFTLARSAVSFRKPAFASLEPGPRIDDESEGSNNWAITPSRTATGRALLANDPHRDHSVPSLRYISHLVAPGLNVIGAGEPALPGISIGHNERIAFGLTIFPIDQADVYVYEKEDDAYRYADGWERFTQVSESIVVRGAENVETKLRFTRHGPVIHETDQHAFAIRAGWLEPGMAPYFGSIDYMRASNWREFLAAMNRWGSPPENQVYADVDGNIGYKPGGLFPRRPNWDGLLPVPGDGRYEWDGFFDMDVLPVEYNPARGFVWSANSMNLPDDYPVEKYTPAYEWTEPWRYRRIEEVLEPQSAHTLQNSTDLQRDYRSLPAIEIVRRIPEAAAGPAADMLRSWDGVMSPASGAAALYKVWLEQHLKPALAAQLLPDQPGLILPLDLRSVIRLMTDERMQSSIIESLSQTYADVQARLGRDSSRWTWGDIHRTNFKHPLLHLAAGELAEQMTYASYPRGGSEATPNNTRSYTREFYVDSGASYRQVLDVGNWDAARMTNAPGQSGDPRSPFYDNLLQGWAEDGDFPLLYSREKILEHKAFSIRLSPK
jgi:penicillin amidase